MSLNVKRTLKIALPLVPLVLVLVNCANHLKNRRNFLPQAANRAINCALRLGKNAGRSFLGPPPARSEIPSSAPPGFFRHNERLSQ